MNLTQAMNHIAAPLRDGILSNARERTVNLEWLGVISMSVVPVVTTSACGLLSLAFYGGWRR
jgi:hypothetical protein